MTVEEGWSGLRTIALQTVGCKLNQAETDSLARKFLDAGYQVVTPTDAADVYLLHTCTVTHIADHKCRKLLRMAYHHSPGSLIVVTGCYAERAPVDLSNIEGVGLIIGSHDKERIVDLVSDKANGHIIYRHQGGLHRQHRRTRALVRIQEGCSQPCSFCIVPRVRGPERSRLEEEVISEVKARVAEGYKEVILTGTRIGRYRQGRGLNGLIARILAECGIQRLRLSSLEPSALTPDLLRLWDDRRLCPQIHLPLQSGSDSVLERMCRAYSTADYQRAVSLARDAIPDLALTTDVMVGFPGESDEEFTESHNFCQRMGFANIHVFPYSARPGTKATELGSKIEGDEKKRRVRLMLDLAVQSNQRFRERFLGHNMNVLWERQKGGRWFGLTGNYLRVSLPSDEPLANEILATDLVALTEDGLWGELTTRRFEF